MKIDNLKFGAVIPTQTYGNLQPSIEMSDVSIEEGIKVGVGFISDLFEKYSEKGGLVPKEIIKVVATKKSFNEEGVEIEFEPVGHNYTHNGKPLVSATEYIKRFYKPFDANTISSVLESKWGIPQQTIRDLWESNGELTSAFGNVVHRALELYDKFKDYGEIISSQQKEKSNYCLPKHPILRSIVEGFLEINKGEIGKVMTEVLLSDIKNGICGTADRIVIIDEAKKICRVKDFKVNIESDKVDKSYKVLAPFNELPSQKLSKYQLQLSVYANMLEHSGWTVQGVDVYIYESEWRHYELPVLKIL